jgi:hypothetical protein
MPVTGFLAALAANQLASRVLPQDLLGRPSHRFTPFPIGDRCRRGSVIRSRVQ